MKISEQLKELIDHKRSSITAIASELNTTQSNLSNKLARDNFKLNDLQEILNVLGYDTLELVIRDSNETVIIRENNIVLQNHHKYMMIEGDNASLIDDIDKNGFREVTMRDLVMEALEPTLKDIFKDMLDVYVPNNLLPYFRDVINNGIVKGFTVAKENIESNQGD